MTDADRAANVVATAQQADRDYNDALTALDRAIVTSNRPSAAVIRADRAPLQLPAGWRGRWLRIVHDWISPVFDRQHAIDTQIVEALEASAARERDRAAAFDRFQTALVIFLQRITAFVESKDRAVAAEFGARLDRQQEAIDRVADLQAQVGVLQRAAQMLTREIRNVKPAVANDVPPDRLVDREGRGNSSAVATNIDGVPSGQSAALGNHLLTDYQYVGFEDRFRGSDAEIREKQRAYVPIFAGASDVLDVGCGRGEFLALLKAEGIAARGVDLNHEMIAIARERGLEVAESDALSYLDSLADASLGGVMAAQVVEHLQPEYLMRLLSAAFHKLRPGAPIVVETINTACWLAFFSSYIRDFTHVRPIHPETLQYLLQASGFGRVAIRYSAPVPEHMKMQAVELSGELADAGRTLNANAAILNNLLFSYLDYAAIGYRP